MRDILFRELTRSRPAEFPEPLLGFAIFPQCNRQISGCVKPRPGCGVAVFRYDSIWHLEVGIRWEIRSAAGRGGEKQAMLRDRVFDAARYRDNPRAIAEYLNGALSTEDPFLITRAISTMVRAQGMTRFSRKAGMRRDSLYRMFTSEASPPFDKVVTLLIALDIQLTAKPAPELKPLAKPSFLPSPQR